MPRPPRQTQVASTSPSVISRGVFRSPRFGALSLGARITYLGLCVLADAETRRVPNLVPLLKADIWPFDEKVGLARVQADLDELASAGFIAISDSTIEVREVDTNGAVVN